MPAVPPTLWIASDPRLTVKFHEAGWTLWISGNDGFWEGIRAVDDQRWVRLFQCLLIPVKMQQVGSDDGEVWPLTQAIVEIPQREDRLVPFGKDNSIRGHLRHDHRPELFGAGVVRRVHAREVERSQGEEVNHHEKPKRQREPFTVTCAKKAMHG